MNVIGRNIQEDKGDNDNMKLIVENKNVYVVSDIHNDADKFKKLLSVIEFSSEDILIINGDIFDRGTKPVELYFEILKYSNIYVIQGNHDVWVKKEIREKYAGMEVGEYLTYNSVELMAERLTPTDLLNLADWIDSKPYYIELTLNGQYFQIAHAQTYLTPKRIFELKKFYMGDFHHEDFLRGEEEFINGISVVGHTPTINGKIWKSKSGRTIRIDCGNGYNCYGCNGALGIIRLNDMREYYV